MGSRATCEMTWETPPELLMLSPGDPLRSARAFVARSHVTDGVMALRYQGQGPPLPGVEDLVRGERARAPWHLADVWPESSGRPAGARRKPAARGRRAGPVLRGDSPARTSRVRTGTRWHAIRPVVVHLSIARVPGF